MQKLVFILFAAIVATGCQSLENAIGPSVDDERFADAMRYIPAGEEIQVAPWAIHYPDVAVATGWTALTLDGLSTYDTSYEGRLALTASLLIHLDYDSALRVFLPRYQTDLTDVQRVVVKDQDWAGSTIWVFVSDGIQSFHVMSPEDDGFLSKLAEQEIEVIRPDLN